jgi:hypothetical protein
MATWHRLRIGELQANESWPLLSSQLLFELRACPICRRPVMRWRSIEEIKAQVLELAYDAAGGSAALAARRLRMSRRAFYSHAPARLQQRIATKRAERTAATAAAAAAAIAGGPESDSEGGQPPGVQAVEERVLHQSKTE